MRRRLMIGGVLTVLAAVGCGGSSSSGSAPATSPAPQPDPAQVTARAAGPRNTDWPLFGVRADRDNVHSAGASATRLRHIRIDAPGTVDSSPIYLRSVTVRGTPRDVFIATTTYGKTFALDARNGRIMWTFTPPGIRSWEGSYRITNASPAADPDRRFVYTASPDGRVHKLSIASGREAGGAWPVSVTRDPTHEKLTSSFNISGAHLIVTTGGYIGDAPPYQGHVVLISRASGHIDGVFNSLCSNRHTIMTPSTCGASDSAIWARGGAVVQPGTGNLLVATGNAPWNGRTDWGDSLLVISPDAQRLLGHWTPSDQAQLNATDADLGSTRPVLLGGDVVVQSGKDARIHVLSMRKILAAGARPVLGGDVQVLPTPDGQPMFSDPVVWHHGGSTTMFATTAAGTAAYVVRGGRLHLSWQNGTGGTSPVLAGGRLWVQVLTGGLDVYRPGSGKRIAHLATGAGHWQSPVLGGGRVLVAEGDANAHRTSGTLSLFVPR